MLQSILTFKHLLHIFFVSLLHHSKYQLISVRYGQCTEEICNECKRKSYMDRDKCSQMSPVEILANSKTNKSELLREKNPHRIWKNKKSKNWMILQKEMLNIALCSTHSKAHARCYHYLQQLGKVLYLQIASARDVYSWRNRKVLIPTVLIRRDTLITKVKFNFATSLQLMGW